jgi:hypothetical protein
LWIFGFQERTNLLYYEPSYFAFSLVIYVSLIIIKTLRFGLRKNIFDIVLIFIALLVTKSGTLLLILPLVYFLSIFCFFNSAKIWIKSAVVVLIFILAASLYVQYSNDSLSRTFRGLFFSSSGIGNSVEFMVARGGNRSPRMQAAGNVFIQKPLFGSGIGAYDFSKIEESIKELKIENSYYLAEIKQTPPTNIYIELLSTGGLAALLGFLLFLASIYSRNKSINNDFIFESYHVAFWTFLIILCCDSNYLRTYLWMLFGMYAGSRVRTDSKRNLYGS